MSPALLPNVMRKFTHLPSNTVQGDMKDFNTTQGGVTCTRAGQCSANHLYEQEIAGLMH